MPNGKGRGYNKISYSIVFVESVVRQGSDMVTMQISFESEKKSEKWVVKQTLKTILEDYGRCHLAAFPRNYQTNVSKTGIKTIANKHKWKTKKRQIPVRLFMPAKSPEGNVVNSLFCMCSVLCFKKSGKTKGISNRNKINLFHFQMHPFRFL